MGFFSDLFGSSQRNDYAQAAAQMQSDIAGANKKAMSTLDTGLTKASEFYQPFRQQGLAGFNQYADAVGVNGAEGYNRAFQNFNADPFAAGAQDASNNALGRMFRQYNARGMGDSGAARLATSRAASEQYNQRVSDYRNRLMGLGQQGYDASNVLGNLTYGNAGQKASIQAGQGQQMAQITGNLANATAQSRTAGVNNVLGLVGNLGGSMFKAAGMGMFG